DDVQSLKAGIMEIADIFVVNKADREGADRTALSIAANLSLQACSADEWQPPILKTEATTGVGVSELWAAVERFRAHSVVSGVRKRRARDEWRLRELIAHRFAQDVERTLAPGEFERVVDRIAARELDPYAAAADIIDRT